MYNRFLILLITIFLLLGPGVGISPAGDKKAPPVPPPLTEEEKEVVETMELLELMDLLEQMDLLADYDIISKEESDEKND